MNDNLRRLVPSSNDLIITSFNENNKFYLQNSLYWSKLTIPFISQLNKYLRFTISLKC